MKAVSDEEIERARARIILELSKGNWSDRSGLVARSRVSKPTLKKITARELVVNVRKNVSIDWTVRENVRAQMRVQVRRILGKYGYPPDKQEKAAETCWSKRLFCQKSGQ